MGRTLNVSETSAMLELQLMFKAFDTDKSGTIDKSELQEMMRQLLGSGEDLDELDDMMREADPSGDGTIDIGEFCEMMGASPAVLSAVSVQKEKKTAQQNTRLKMLNDGTIHNWKDPRKAGFYRRQAAETAINRCERREQLRKRDFSRRARLNFAHKSCVHNGALAGSPMGSGVGTRSSPKYLNRLHRELQEEHITNPAAGSRSQTPKLLGTRSPLRSQTVVQLLPPASAPLPHLQRPHTSIGVAAGGFCSPPPPYTPMQTEKHVRATAQYHRKPAHQHDVAMAACVKPHKYRGSRTAHNAEAIVKRPLTSNHIPNYQPRVCTPVRSVPKRRGGGHCLKGHPLSVRLCNKCGGWFESLKHLTAHHMLCGGIPAKRKHRVAQRDSKIETAIATEECAAVKIQSTFRMMRSSDLVRGMQMDRKKACSKIQKTWRRRKFKQELRLSVDKASSLYKAASVRPFIWVLLDGWTDDERDVGLLWSTLIHSVQKREDWKILEMAIARTPQQWNKQYCAAVERYQQYETKFPGGRRCSVQPAPQELKTSKQTDYAIMDISFNDDDNLNDKPELNDLFEDKQ